MRLPCRVFQAPTASRPDVTNSLMAAKYSVIPRYNKSLWPAPLMVSMRLLTEVISSYIAAASWWGARVSTSP